MIPQVIHKLNGAIKSIAIQVEIQYDPNRGRDPILRKVCLPLPGIYEQYFLNITKIYVNM